MLQFSANIGLLFTELPFRDRFKAARAAGFDAVEFPFTSELTADQLRDLLDESEMTQSLANMPYEIADLGLAASPGQEARFQERLSCSIHYASATRCKTLHVLAGRLPDDAEKGAAENALRANLSYAAKLAAETGLIVVVEAINRRDVPDFSLESVRHAAAVIGSLDVPNLRLLLDLYHAGTIGEDMPTVIESYAKLVGYCQLAGFDGRHEPADGRADYAQLLTMLAKAGYDGYVGCEYRPRANTNSGLSWLASIKEQIGSQ
jgi:hydroxypyruvate isomerase